MTVSKSSWIVYTVILLIVLYQYVILPTHHPAFRQVAARTLGDLVRKLGERVLPEIIPILEKGLDCEDRPDQRQGVCIGLSEIIGSTSREHVLTFR